MSQFYMQLDANNIIRDIITYPYSDYVLVEIPTPLPAGINGGWYRWDGNKPVYDRTLFEQENEVPELTAARDEYNIIKPIVSNMASSLYEKGAINSDNLFEISQIFPAWTSEFRGNRGAIVRDEGKLYQSLHDVTNVGHNVKPSISPSMWAPIANPAEEWPEWMPYAGVVVYMKGSKSMHNGKKWVSTTDNNVWEPSVYGWVEQK